MIKVHKNNDGKQFVLASELFDFLELSKPHYNRVITQWLEEEYLFQREDNFRTPKKGIDYSPYMESKKGRGQFKQDYNLSLELSKLIALDSRSKMKKQYVQWLLSLEQKVNDLELLTIDQAAYLFQLLNYFKFVSNQQKVLKEHQSKFVAQKAGDKYAYGNFYKWRNSILGISQEELDKQLLEYCKANQKSISITKKSKVEKIFTLDNYASLKHAVWDMLHIKGEKALAEKMSELVYNLAKKSNTEVKRQNETNLFDNRENAPQPKRLTAFGAKSLVG